jgi:hypothetical protein
LAPFRRRAATWVWWLPFGFSWRVAVLPRRPPAMRVGFSWISLDSLVRIETFQWVTQLLAARFFLAPLSVAWDPPERETAVLACRSAGLFMGKLNLVSDFLQEIVVRPIFLSPAGSCSRISLRGREARTLKGDVFGRRSARRTILPDMPPPGEVLRRSSLRGPFTGSADRRGRADFRRECDPWPG